MSQCVQCEGSGLVTYNEPAMTTGRSMPYDCPLCLGRGEVGVTSIRPPKVPTPKQWPRWRGERGKVNAKARKRKRKAQKKARRAGRKA